MPIASPRRSRHLEPLAPEGVGYRAEALLLNLRSVDVPHRITQHRPSEQLQRFCIWAI
jgi:hypothetical protein